MQITVAGVDQVQGGGASSDSDYTHVAKLRGLPWNTTHEDIAKFVSDVTLDEDAVWLLHNARYACTHYIYLVSFSLHIVHTVETTPCSRYCIVLSSITVLHVRQALFTIVLSILCFCI
jgi:hypothetical protein